MLCKCLLQLAAMPYGPARRAKSIGIRSLSKSFHLSCKIFVCSQVFASLERLFLEVSRTDVRDRESQRLGRRKFSLQDLKLERNLGPWPVAADPASCGMTRQRRRNWFLVAKVPTSVLPTLEFSNSNTCRWPLSSEHCVGFQGTWLQSQLAISSFCRLCLDSWTMDGWFANYHGSWLSCRLHWHAVHLREIVPCHLFL